MAAQTEPTKCFQESNLDKDDDNTSSLLLASKEGNLAIVKTLVGLKPKGDIRSNYINQKDQNGNTSLNLAVYEGHPDIASFLIAEEADLGSLNELLRLAVCNAKMDSKVVEIVLNSIPEAKRAGYINAGDGGGNTTMHWASLRGNLPAIEQLLKAGGKVAEVNSDGQTPLMAAVLSSNVDILKLLVSNAESSGISKLNYVNMKQKEGDSALEIAVDEGHAEIASYLILENADLGRVEELLSFAAGNKKSNVHVVKVVLNAIAEVDRPDCINAFDRGGNTALHWAATRGNSLGLDLLVRAGGQLAQKNRNGRTPLMMAILSAQEDTVHFILDNYYKLKESFE